MTPTTLCLITMDVVCPATSHSCLQPSLLMSLDSEKLTGKAMDLVAEAEVSPDDSQSEEGLGCCSENWKAALGVL